MGFGISEVVSSFGRSLGYGLSFDSYIPKPETFGNALRGFDTHVYMKLCYVTAIYNNFTIL